MTNLVVETLNCVTIKVNTPDGTMFVTISDKHDKPYRVHIHIGKSGNNIQAWADALARSVSLLLQNNTPLFAIVIELSGITSARSVRHINKVNIRSGPEGLVYALMQYMRLRHEVKDDQIMEFGGFE